MNTSARILSDITTFIFIKDEPQQADIIIVPGCAWPDLAENAADLYQQGFAPYVLPTGKFSYKRERFDGPRSKQDIYSDRYETEWAFQRDVLTKNGVPEHAVLREDRSTNTVENAFFAKKAADDAGLAIKTAILCCKAYHARRCLMTFGWAFPDVDFIICPTQTQGIGRDTWQSTAAGREKVLSEVSKCGSYFTDVAGIWSQGEQCQTSN